MNTGERPFSIRVQEDGKLIKEVSINEGEFKKVKLAKDQELYLDPNSEGIAKTRVSYEKAD